MSGAKRLLGGLLDLLFPPKCALCGRLLDRETDLCRDCRKETEEFPASAPKKHPDQKTGPQFLDSFTAVWLLESGRKAAGIDRIPLLDTCGIYKSISQAILPFVHFLVS